MKNITEKEAVSLINKFVEAADLDDLAMMVSQFCSDEPVKVSKEDGTDSDIFRDGKIPRPLVPVIRATVNTDDLVISVNFCAERWFKQASDDDIIALAECDWGGDYPSDAIAIYMENDEEVNRIFVHIQNMNGISAHSNIGFECHVAVADAMKWLTKHKPNLAKKFHNDENIDSSTDDPSDV